MKRSFLGILGLVGAGLVVLSFQNCGNFSTGDFGSQAPSLTSSGGGGSTSPQASLEVGAADPGTVVQAELVLSAAAVQDLEYTISTENETAVAGENFTAKNITAVLPRGLTRVVFEVPTTNDLGVVYLGRKFKINASIPTLNYQAAATVTFISGLGAVNLLNHWKPMSTLNNPGARTQAAAVWTGTHLLVWGGFVNQTYLNTGGRYDPATNTWTAMSVAGAPAPRANFLSVWTGKRLLVWGGHNRVNLSGMFHADGGQYDPATDSWAPITATGAPDANWTAGSVVWTGSRMLVIGGWGTCGLACTSSNYSYDPETNTWSTLGGTPSPLSARGYSTITWTGKKVIVWGGHIGGSQSTNDGAMFDPANGTWTLMSTVNAPSFRQSKAVWTGTHMFVPGTFITSFVPGVPGVADGGGFLFDPVANQWTAASATNATIGNPVGWTGSKVIVYNGISLGMYDPKANVWTPGSTAGAPSIQTTVAVVWATNKLLAWGAGSFNGVSNVYGTDGYIFE